MAWTQISILTRAEEAELLADLFTALDAEAVSLVDGGSEDLFQLQPEHTPVWQRTCVHALYPTSIDPDTIIQRLKKISGLSDFEASFETLEEQDWVRITQSSFKPLHFANRLSIYPSWESPEASSAAKIVIDPGLAFGTGTHPTTQLCLEYLATHPPQEQSVIDYGCGSGILALSALALGADTVWAVDHDSQALIATQNNAELNHFGPPRLHTALPEALPPIAVDCVITNILANPLLQLAERLLKLLKPQAVLLLSGLLEAEVDSLLKCYERHFDQAEVKILEGWARIVFRR